MAVNEPLENIVLLELSKHISSIDPVFKMLADGDDNIVKEVIKVRVRNHIDEANKIRMHFGYFIGYGYDFTKKDEGTPAKEIYNRAVKMTKKFSGTPSMERFVKDGIADNRYGWYITSLK